jgi:hypothetical protein
MRISAFVALALATMTTLASRPATAAYNLPWCATYYESNITSCAFTSFDQCMVTVRGVGGLCTRNILYPPEPVTSEPHRGKPQRVSGYY